jgi:hypothetical protein
MLTQIHDEQLADVRGGARRLAAASTWSNVAPIWSNVAPMLIMQMKTLIDQLLAGASGQMSKLLPMMLAFRNGDAAAIGAAMTGTAAKPPDAPADAAKK